MSFRFRRSFKIAPGLRLNVGKRGVSLSAGVRGAHVTVGRTGVTQSIGIPGTGLSFTSRRGRSRRRVSQSARSVESSAPAPVIAADRFGIFAAPIPETAGRARMALFIAAGLSLCAVFIVSEPYRPVTTVTAVGLFVIGLVCQSRGTLERREQARVQQLARAELTRRIDGFATAVAGLTAVDERLTPERLRGVLAKQRTLGLTDLEVAMYRTDVLQATAELLEFEAGCGGHLPAVAGHEQYVSPDVCYFVGAAIYDKRGDNDPSGTLYLTNARAVFGSADGLVTTPWTKVVATTRSGRTVSIQRRDRQTPYLFVFGGYAEAMKADFVARNILAAPTGALAIGASEIVSEDVRRQPSAPLSSILLGRSS
jgi:hypothetical protein